MNEYILIIIAILVDVLLGDPQFRLHPIRLIGDLACFVEKMMRRLIKNEKMAGIMAFILIVFCTISITLLVLQILYSINIYIGIIGEIFVLYFCFSAKDLSKHSKKIYIHIKNNEIMNARNAVSMLVSRDTSILDKKGIIRAAIESVSENFVDGVLSPIIYAILLGPLGAVGYKTISTLDSMFGYKNDKYLNFGWFSAKVDDIVNYIPARLAPIIIYISSILLRLNSTNMISVWKKDSKKHESPNSAIAESCFAGALGIELGGTNIYFDKVINRPVIGIALNELSEKHILIANRLMWTSLFVFIFIIVFMYMLVNIL